MTGLQFPRPDDTGPNQGVLTEDAPEPLRVLVVDDSPSDRALLRAQLEEQDRGLFAVEICTTLRGALTRLESAPAACVILDLGLPDAVHLEGLAAIRRQSAIVPVVVVTGQDDDALGEAAMRAGAQDYVSKSDVTSSILRRAVRHAIERQRQQLQLEQTRQALDLEIAARRQIEAVNRATSSFLSRMSHELRTPMNAVLGFAQILAHGNLDEDDTASVAHILQAGRHLLHLIDDVLDISEIDSGRLAVAHDAMSLIDVVREAVELHRPMAERNGISISTAFDDPSAVVVGDRPRLLQVVSNLLSNAIKYNRADGTVAVTCSRIGDVTRVAVRDTGPGIADEFHDRVFEPFDRLGEHDVAVEGTGIGLTLAKRLVEAMQGTIGFTTTLGQGSTFWFELPTATRSLATVPTGV